MDFAVSQETQLIVDTVRRFVAKELQPLEAESSGTTVEPSDSGEGGNTAGDGVPDADRTRRWDLILLDQRGTGYSEPTLDCPEAAAEDQTEAESLVGPGR